MNRRFFLKSGACSLVALAGPPRFLVRAAAAADARGKVLVAIFQRGAVDGLSMVVPHGDPAYYAARSSIALGRPRAGLAGPPGRLRPRARRRFGPSRSDRGCRAACAARPARSP